MNVLSLCIFGAKIFVYLNLALSFKITNTVVENTLTVVSGGYRLFL